LSLDVARTVAGWPGEVGLVVAGNDLAALRAIRSVRPDAWFLAPGIGAQGGAMDEAVAAGLREDGLGLLPVVARGIANADDPAQAALSFVDEFRAARDGVGAARDAAGPVDDSDDSDLLDAILATGCFRVGSFTLKSGIVSPFYIDLRRLQSDPAALETAAAAYERLIVRSGLRADRIAGIPVAALSLATALSLRTRLPLIYPRLPAKPHGTGNRIEGAWEPGERALLVDDLITTGLSKLEAVAVLREDGLVVEDLLVLIERGTAGRSDLAAEGIRVHAAADIRDLVERGVMRQYVTPADRDRIFRFLQESP
ncbi:MAG TPA: orotate phosphoribosyltransferase, partial [Spirochaetia bacterium]|nr:orotate phosphoribosyltransferase [Spirochaetia bacterium]